MSKRTVPVLGRRCGRAEASPGYRAPHRPSVPAYSILNNADPDGMEPSKYPVPPDYSGIHVIQQRKNENPISSDGGLKKRGRLTVELWNAIEKGVWGILADINRKSFTVISTIINQLIIEASSP